MSGAVGTQALIPFVVFAGKDDNIPKPRQAIWDELTHGLTTFAERESKDGPAWSPAIYALDTTRGNENVEAITALVYDLDNDAQEFLNHPPKALRNVAHVIHSTYSHAIDAPRVRVVIRLLDPILAADYPDAWARGAALCGGAVDPAAKDLARLHYLPSHPPGVKGFSRVVAGDPLDWRILPPAPTIRRSPLSSPNGKAAGTGHTVYPPFTQPLGEGERNATLTSEAGRLRRVGATETMVYGALSALNAERCNPPLSDNEVSIIAHSVTRYEPAPSVYPLTDSGNGERFAAAYGEQFRYVEQWGWLHFDKKRWARDLVGERFRASKAVTRNIYREASEALDDERRKAIASWAKASESQARRDAMLALARWELPITARVEQFDTDIYALNVANGVIDLRSGELRPHDPADLITKLTDVEYDPTATAPTFERFLERIVPSAGVRGYLQRWNGYSATGSAREERLGIWFGSGDNGKTTLERIIQHVLGEYAKQIDPEVLMQSRNDQHPAGKADLLGVRAAFAAETEQGRRLAESRVKNLVSTDPISARFMRQDFFVFDPTHSLVLLTNHKPEIHDTGHGMWRRLDLVPFTVIIPGQEKDPKLLEKLKVEASGILAWIVAGAADWYRLGLPRVAEITAATAQYRQESDSLGDFLIERCLLDPTATITKKALHTAYADWCQPEKPATKKTFGTMLSERGIESSRGGGARLWVGIRLRVANDPEPNDTMTHHDTFSGINSCVLDPHVVNLEIASQCVMCHDLTLDVGAWVFPIDRDGVRLSPAPVQIVDVAELDGQSWYALSGTSSRFPADRLEPAPSPTAAEGAAANAEAVSALLTWAEANDWPRMPIGPGTAIGAGETCWQVFLKRASPDLVLRAEQAACQDRDDVDVEELAL